MNEGVSLSQNSHLSQILVATTTEMMKVLLGCFNSNLKGIDYD
jgi:hypothetical protein